MKKKNDLIQMIKKMKDTGFFSIFVSTIFSKVIAFLGNIIIVKILSKNDYGIYAYAINAMTMLYIFNDFGASSSALQSLTEEKDNKEKQRKILKYAIKLGLTGSLISGVLILLSPYFYPFEIVEAKKYTPILFLIPIFTNINAFVLVVLRANLENKKYAILNIVSTLFNYMFLIILSIKYGIMGAIISQYCYIIIICVLGIIISRRTVGNFFKATSTSKKEKKKFLKYAMTTQINSTLSSLLLNIDIFTIGIILSSSTIVATYKVSTVIPMALSFLPSCVMIYVLPHFIMHNKDIRWVKRNYVRLIKYGALIYGMITIILCFSSKWIFNLLYGDVYNDAVTAFNMLIIGFFFHATFEIPTNNIFYSMRKLKINLIVTISSVILNFILNIALINAIGMNGAALSTMSIHIFASIILIIYARSHILNKDEVDKNEKTNN